MEHTACFFFNFNIKSKFRSRPLNSRNGCCRMKLNTTVILNCSVQIVWFIVIKAAEREMVAMLQHQAPVWVPSALSIRLALLIKKKYS